MPIGGTCAKFRRGTVIEALHHVDEPDRRQIRPAHRDDRHPAIVLALQAVEHGHGEHAIDGREVGVEKRSGRGFSSAELHGLRQDPVLRRRPVESPKCSMCTPMRSIMVRNRLHIGVSLRATTRRPVLK